MKRLVLISWLCLGCAGAAPQAVSQDQARTFQATVERVKRIGVGDTYTPAATKLREAEADFYYAQHSPKNPARAQEMAVRAQQEAEAALELATREAAIERQQKLTPPPTPGSPSATPGLELATAAGTGAAPTGNAGVTATTVAAPSPEPSEPATDVVTLPAATPTTAAPLAPQSSAAPGPAQPSDQLVFTSANP